MTSPVSNDVACPIFLYAFSLYENNSKHGRVDYEEFSEDYQRFWYIIKLLVIYRNSGELNVRLLFNHLIICTNKFGKEAAMILMRIVLDKGNYEVICLAMTMLHYVGYIPDDKFMKILDDEYILEDIEISKTFLEFIEEKLNDAEDL